MALGILAELEVAEQAEPLLPGLPAASYPMRSVFRLDHHGDAVALLPGNFEVVLLVWPNLGTPFGEQVAHAMRCGQVMIFEGEEKGGNTATEEFFEVLSADFECLDAETHALNEHHRAFPGLHDKWQILRKNN